MNNTSIWVQDQHGVLYRVIHMRAYQAVWNGSIPQASSFTLKSGVQSVLFEWEKDLSDINTKEGPILFFIDLCRILSVELIER